MLEDFCHSTERLLSYVFDLRIESFLPGELTLLIVATGVLGIRIQSLDELICAHDEFSGLH